MSTADETVSMQVVTAAASNDSTPTDWPPHLTLDTERVLRLFTGESFYSSADAAIREAVLNAIDAITRRDAETKVEPSIDIVMNRDDLTLVIADNGDGMGQVELTTLFSKVAASASSFSDGQKNLNAIGEFGIGALSYFLICDRYQVQTLKDGGTAIGLQFSAAMLDGKTRATEIEATRTTVGTTLTLFLKSEKEFDLLVDRFPHWIRNVAGLSAQIAPEGKLLAQGGLTRKVHRIEAVEQPEWVEEADIGPPDELSVWDQYDGRGRVDVLYRGVFVERAEIDGLWGLEGAIHVNPKHFRPKLNREGFIGQDLKNQVTPFLTANHPLILREAVQCIHTLLDSKDEWNFSRALTLWLAVPRNTKYEQAAKAWDAEFRGRKAFRQFGPTSDRDTSVSEISAIGAETVYLAPDNLAKSSDVVRHAVRVLRARNEVVVQGIPRDGGYLTTAPLQAQTTSWLLLNAFRNELPTVVAVETVAENLVRQDSVADVLASSPIVKLVRLGGDSSPILAIRREIWINVDTAKGRSIVEEICKRNEGHLSLWVACMMHAPEQGDRLNEIGRLLRDRTGAVERLGLVQRQHLRSFLT